uniref:RNA polymerase II C-terminal domain phosphatase-like n=1 Tax=Leersia perrieri TaxID=77586 RepID=A0A0D9VM55_9ORYZ
MDPSSAAGAGSGVSTGWMEQEEVEDNASTGAPVEEDDAGDWGEEIGEAAAADDDYYYDDTTDSPGSISNDSILLSPESTSGHLGTLMREKKLILVLDLDHTLINSVKFRELSPMEEAIGFTKHTGDDPGRGLFRLVSNLRPQYPMLTKLRPFVREFLEQSSDMFEMHAYTLGSRDYAESVVKLLDPDGVYFGNRIVSKNESPRDGKSLEVVPVGSSASAANDAAAAMVVILDDTAWVWERDKRGVNLIEMERYLYFANSRRHYGLEGESLSERRADESSHGEGSALAAALGLLRRVHDCFFREAVCAGSFSDARVVIAQLRLVVLRGCTVAFVGVADEPNTGGHRTRRRAAQLGAKCVDVVGEAVTHVVAGTPGTLEAQWAVDHGKFLVGEEWINRAHFRWIKPPEGDFPAP